MNKPISTIFTAMKFNVCRSIQPQKSMKRVRIIALSLVILAALFAPATHAQANNKPPGKMTFQGFLTDSSGNPLGLSAPTNLTVFFRLYKNSQGTAATDKLWAEQQVVTIDRGHFSVLLGEGTATGIGGDPANGAISLHFLSAVTRRIVSWASKCRGNRKWRRESSFSRRRIRSWRKTRTT